MATMCIEAFLAMKGVTEQEKKNAHIRVLNGKNGQYKAVVFPWGLSDIVNAAGERVTALFVSPSKNLAKKMEAAGEELTNEWVLAHKGELQIAEGTIAEGERKGQPIYSLCLVDQSEAIDFTGF